MTAHIQSSGSMSSHSDQETSKGSPYISQSSQVISKTNQDVHQKLSDVTRDDEFNEKGRNIVVDDGSKESSPKDDVSSVFMDKTSGDKDAVEDRQSLPEDHENLRQKLSAALLNVSIKDDLVQQHSKVAEEAVAGWEKAEKEAAALKEQLDAEAQSKSALESRVSHLDEALKECVRQHRLGRDEQQKKINKVVAERTSELELAKTQLEDRLVELQRLVQTSSVSCPDPELQDKLESFERENVALRKQLKSQCEELEVRTIERDLSTKVAETASKQHLESIKKIAKLEAECRKLKSLTRMSSLSNDHRSTVAASSYAESLTEILSDGLEQLGASESNGRKMNGWGSHECTPSRSDSWASDLITELDQFKGEKAMDRNLHSSKEINLMDDFLEMERLAALPDSEPQVCDQTSEKPVFDTENEFRAELKALAHRTAELEKIKGRLEEEKAELEIALAQTQRCLDNSEVQLIEAHIKLEQLERDLLGANEREQFYKTVTDNLEQETKLMSSEIRSLRCEMERERTLSEEKTCKLEELGRELKKKEQELRMQQELISNGDLKLKELALAESQDCFEKSQVQLQGLEKELQEANEENKSLKSELDGVQVQVLSMSAQVELLNQQLQEKQQKEQALVAELTHKVKESERMCVEIESLNRRIQKEQALVAQLSTQVKDIERELRQKRLELDAQQRAHTNIEMRIKKEDVAAAAGKLADCQKTIACLGSQLKSLATLEDFLIDTASIPGFSPPSASMAGRSNGEPWKLHLNNTFLAEKGSGPLCPIREGFSHNRGDCGEPPESSSSSDFFLNQSGPRNVEDGFAKYFSISRN